MRGDGILGVPLRFSDFPQIEQKTGDEDGLQPIDQVVNWFVVMHRP